MAIDAIPGDVEDAILEPFDGNVTGGEGAILDLGEGLDPVNAPALLGPESRGILHRARVHLLIFGLIDPGALCPFSADVINLLGHRFLRSMAWWFSSNSHHALLCCLST